MVILESSVAHSQKMEAKSLDIQARSLDNERSAQWFAFLLPCLSIAALLILSWFAYKLYLGGKTLPATIFLVADALVLIVGYATVKRWLRSSSDSAEPPSPDPTP